MHRPSRRPGAGVTVTVTLIRGDLTMNVPYAFSCNFRNTEQASCLEKSFRNVYISFHICVSMHKDDSDNQHVIIYGKQLAYTG